MRHRGRSYSSELSTSMTSPSPESRRRLAAGSSAISATAGDWSAVDSRCERARTGGRPGRHAEPVLGATRPPWQPTQSHSPPAPRMAADTAVFARTLHVVRPLEGHAAALRGRRSDRVTLGTGLERLVVTGRAEGLLRLVGQVIKGYQPRQTVRAPMIHRLVGLAAHQTRDGPRAA